MQTTVRTALQLKPGEHVIRVRHASGGWFTLHPITVSVAEPMVGTAAGQASAAAELGTALEQSPTPTLLSVTPNPVTIGQTLTISGTAATRIDLSGSAAGAAAAQATPTVLEPTPTPLLTSVSPNPVTIGQLLTISGSADANLAVSGTAAGQAAATATITVGRAITGAAAGVGGASASSIGITVGGGSAHPANGAFESAIGGDLVDSGDLTNWSVYLGGAGTAARTTSSPITGTGSGRLAGSSVTDDCRLVCRATKATVDAGTGHLRFKFRRNSTSGSAALAVCAYVFSDVTFIGSDGANEAKVLICGNSLAGSNTSLAYVSSVTNGTVYSVDFDVRTFAQGNASWAAATDLRLDFMTFGLIDVTIDDVEIV